MTETGTLCRHFGSCGGCALQDMAPDDYRAAKRGLVVEALARAGFSAEAMVDPAVQVPENSRRRAVFKLAGDGEGVRIGFHGPRSHAIVDMRECLVLTPSMVELVQKLRASPVPLLHNGGNLELHVTETDTGFDLAFRGPRAVTPALTARIAAAIAGLGVARVVFNGELILENRAPRIAFDRIEVAPHPHAFLQPTMAGEVALREKILALTRGAKNIADLFAGMGTFSLPLARAARVHAVEEDGAALAALAAASRAAKGLKPVTTEKRDLFKVPFTVLELNRFDAVVLDPPRAGAQAQARQLADSKVGRIAYVSCDPASFARDARILCDGGYRMGMVTPVDQFLYANHIELVAGFSRL